MMSTYTTYQVGNNDKCRNVRRNNSVWLRSSLAFGGAVGISLALFLLMSHLTKAPKPESISFSPSVSFLRMMVDSPIAESPEPLPDTSPPPAVDQPPELPNPIAESTLKSVTEISSPKVETPKLDLPEITPAVSGNVLAGVQARSAPIQKQQVQPVTSPSAVATNLTATDRIASPSVAIGDLSIGQEVMVLHKATPQYPRRALQRRQEGWVKIRFDVTAQGRATNLQVVEAKPQGMFDRSALESLQHWRFKPKQVNGKAVMRYNMIQVIEYKL